MRNLMNITDLTLEEIDELIATAEDIIANPEKYQDACNHKLLAALFFEPSTRTRLSFEAAMQRLGGMTEFVAQGWAGKDYTHINYAGGREIARMLYYAMLQGAQRYSHMMRARMEQSKPIMSEPLQLQQTIEPVMLHDSIIKLPN